MKAAPTPRRFGNPHAAAQRKAEMEEARRRQLAERAKQEEENQRAKREAREQFEIQREREAQEQLKALIARSTEADKKVEEMRTQVRTRMRSNNRRPRVHAAAQLFEYSNTHPQ